MFDIAFDTWLKDAERAWDDVSDVQRALRDTVVSRPEDRPLKMMAVLIGASMAAETPEELLTVQAFVRRERNLLRCPGSGVTTRRIDAMLARGRGLLDEIGGLDVFQPVEHVVDLPDTVANCELEAA